MRIFVVCFAFVVASSGCWGGDDADSEKSPGDGHSHAEGEADHHHGHGGDHSAEDGDGSHHHSGGEKHEHDRHEGDPGTGAEPSPEAEKRGTVEVSREGTKFDPPVSRERLPAGAWYCDLGEVPWASLEKPEEGCPIADVPLKKYEGDGGAE